jgi:pre-mRNA-splicing factor ISY1
VAAWDALEQERLDAFAAATGKKADKLAAQQQEAEPQFVAYVPLPDQAAIEQRVLEKKKQDLLAKYTSESLQKQQEEAKSLLNKR